MLSWALTFLVIALIAAVGYFSSAIEFSQRSIFDFQQLRDALSD